jgi:hypothetical protein
VLLLATQQTLQLDTASTEISSTSFFIPFTLLTNKTTVFVSPVPTHISTQHQQIADTLSVLGLDPLHTIMQWTVIEITVAGALTTKQNYCNADCYLLPKDTVISADTD